MNYRRLQNLSRLFLNYSFQDKLCYKYREQLNQNSRLVEVLIRRIDQLAVLIEKSRNEISNHQDSNKRIADCKESAVVFKKLTLAGLEKSSQKLYEKLSVCLQKRKKLKQVLINYNQERNSINK